MFDPVWLDGSNLFKYPFPLVPALAEKFGYDSVEAFKKDAQKRYSLLDNGMLDMPCAPQLIANVSPFRAWQFNPFHFVAG